MDFLHENNFCKTHFSTNQNSRKNLIQLIEYFTIGNDGRVNTDPNERIFPLNTSSFRSTNDGERKNFCYFSRAENKKHPFLRLCGWFCCPTDFCLTLETGRKCIFSLDIIFVRRWFSDQSELEKKSNSINRVF